MNTGKTHFKKGIEPWNKGVLIVKNCRNCRKEYSVHPYRAQTSKVCSKTCYRTRTCVSCGQSFQCGGRIVQKYCSFSCNVKEMKGKTPKNIAMIAGWNKGKKFAYKARPPMLGKPGGRLGKKLSPIQLEKLSHSHLGQKAWNRGLKVPQMTGELHPRWVKDRSKLKRGDEDNRQRNSSAARWWSRQVKNRDGWKCKISNGNCSGRVESHHILSWRDFVELRYEINNGITLCLTHHPRVRAEAKRLIPVFTELVAVSKVKN